jgi:hypothetical protein
MIQTILFFTSLAVTGGAVWTMNRAFSIVERANDATRDSEAIRRNAEQDYCNTVNRLEADVARWKKLHADLLKLRGKRAVRVTNTTGVLGASSVRPPLTIDESHSTGAV